MAIAPGVRRGCIFTHLFVHSFIYILFVNIKLSMLSNRGQGMLLNAMQPCWIDRYLIGDSVVAVIVKGYRQQ